MRYFNDSILYTEADVIVYPFLIGPAVIPNTLHAAVTLFAGKEYYEFWKTGAAGGRYRPGHPIINYIREDDWMGRWVIGLPCSAEMKFEDFREGVLRTMEMFKACDGADTLAILRPMEPCEWDEDTQEAVWTWAEWWHLRDRPEKEVWMYTEGLDLEPRVAEEAIRVEEFYEEDEMVGGQQKSDAELVQEVLAARGED